MDAFGSSKIATILSATTSEACFGLDSPSQMAAPITVGGAAADVDALRPFNWDSSFCRACSVIAVNTNYKRSIASMMTGETWKSIVARC
jgi:hypothetical protein